MFNRPPTHEITDSPVRRSTGFPLDDLTFVLRHLLAQLNRDSI